MNRSERRSLPVLGAPHSRRSSDAATGSDSWLAGVQPDPERLRAGWEHRFVADAERAREMVQLYLELGFEVAADPVRLDAAEGGCTACFEESDQGYRSIYTRRASERAADLRPEG
ncbi:MAG: hypothetical protein ABFS34_02935 [Gemmatimonadota bacterium]